MGQVVEIRKGSSKTPNIENGKVPPARQRNADQRPREYLRPDEVEALEKAAAKLGRHGHRDRTLITMIFRHALRVSEAVSLQWDMIDLKQGQIHVTRRKNGVPSSHPLRGPELRALRRLKREYPDSPYLFVTERGGPMTAATVRKMVARAGKAAGMEWTVHPHMLRHACGYKLANEGHDTRSIQHYMGHKNIQHTVRYTELSPERFKGFFKD